MTGSRHSAGSRTRASLRSVAARRALVSALLAALFSAPGPARAHDIWLHAERFRLEPGETLVVRQLVGDELEADLARLEATQELPLLVDMTPRFALVTPAGAVDLLGERGARRSVKPVLERTLDFEGPALVAMEHAILYTEFTSAEFLEYLEHEGLDPERYREHMGSRPRQTEGYQRTLKCLVRVGPGGSADLHGRPLGQPLEILLLQDPDRLDPGDELEVRVLLHGEPLAGQPVNAYHGSETASGEGAVARLRARTDAAGVARFRLGAAGVWLVRLVYLAPCSERSGVDCADTAWESYWSAFSFAVD